MMVFILEVFETLSLDWQCKALALVILEIKIYSSCVAVPADFLSGSCITLFSYMHKVVCVALNMLLHFYNLLNGIAFLMA